MAVTVSASGTSTQTAGGAETQLADTAATGVYTFHVDTNLMAAGDVIYLRIYQMVLTAGTSRVLYQMAYYGAQVADDKIKVSVPVVNELTDSTALRFSIEQPLGTTRALPFKVLKIAA